MTTKVAWSTGFNAYWHSPLANENSIRLLRLQPGLPSTNIEIDLFEVTLSNLPDYEALSYAWDSQEPDHKVSCDGKELAITANCNGALNRFRWTNRPRILWVDSICIDQSSLEERGHQVRLMGDVYSKANLVLIWLGEECLWSNFTISFFNDYHDVLTSSQSSSSRDKRLDQIVQTLRDEETNALRLRLNRSTVVESICARSWFTRLWTVQEYVLSRDACFVCGQKQIQASKFFSSLQSLVEYRRRSHDQAIYTDPWQSSIISYVFVFSKIKDFLYQPTSGGPISLTEILAEGRNQTVSKPKDAVFGIYGMVRLLGIPFPVPDYRKSIERIYLEATKAAITADKSLSVLLETSESENRSSLPSWVPDWNSGLDHTICVRNITGKSGISYFKAARDSSARFKFLNEDRILRVRGLVVDKIVDCAEVSFQHSDYYAGLHLKRSSSLNTWFEPLQLGAYEIFRDWMATASALPSYHSGEKVECAFRRTLTLDYTNWAEAAHLHHFNERAGFNHWLQSQLLGNRFRPAIERKGLSVHFNYNHEFEKDLLASIGQRKSTIKQSQAENNGLPSHLRPTTPLGSSRILPYNAAEFAILSNRRNENAMTFQKLAISHSLGMLFFTTEAGYMGKGLLSIRSGDVIVLIAGVDVPMIARKSSSTYRLQGPAYVHGIMHGEKWPRDESTLIDIKIS